MNNKIKIPVLVLLLMLTFMLTACGNTSGSLHCTMTINANPVLESSLASDEIKELIPENGLFASKEEVAFSEGDTLKDAFTAFAKKKKIAINAKTNYVESIGGVGQQVCGSASGWMVTVNGEYTQETYDQYKLKDGDEIVWEYYVGDGSM